MISAAENLYIGCSGWDYDDWEDDFYQRKGKDRFQQYAGQFSTVEINNTFYRLPEREVFRSWRDQAPKGFVYSVKANRYITHMKKLKDSEKAAGKMCESLSALGDHLGPVLFQMPPNFKARPDRLSGFIEALPAGNQYAFEFRNSSWYDKRILSELDSEGRTMCLHDMPSSASPVEELGSFCYVRFHGPEGDYSGSYERTEIERWAGFLRKVLEGGKKAYVYFNNDKGCNAPKDAKRLLNALKKTQ